LPRCCLVWRRLLWTSLSWVSLSWTSLPWVSLPWTSPVWGAGAVGGWDDADLRPVSSGGGEARCL
jgi:hypothetical protein